MTRGIVFPGYGAGVRGMAGPVDGPGAPRAMPSFDVQRSRLSRVIDVDWWAPVVGSLLPSGNRGPRHHQGFAFGGLQYQPDEPAQLDAEDWVVYAQPLNVLPFERPPAEFYKAGTDWNPGPAWWPEAAPYIARSPFALVTTAGPETGVVQVTPIPALGCAVPLRGRNISATIVYDAGAVLPAPPPPYELPIQLEGAGAIALVIAKAQPTTHRLTWQARCIDVNTTGQPQPFSFPAFLPKFSVLIPYGQTFAPYGPFEFLSPTGQVLAGAGTLGDNIYIPQAAVAIRSVLGDSRIEQAGVVEVFE